MKPFKECTRESFGPLQKSNWYIFNDNDTLSDIVREVRPNWDFSQPIKIKIQIGKKQLLVLFHEKVDLSKIDIQGENS
jgi:hypothetical protein